ncbi:MAG: hypothetical protein ABSB49_18895 [Polyangia bacterium]|jgi:hypothetical protein
MRRLSTIIISVAVWLALATSAEAKTVEYLSPHPVPHKYGGGFCNINVAHVHNYPPDDPRLYRDIGGQLYFVGDPTPFQYQGPRYSYYGAHPVVDSGATLGQPVYCYLKGPHYHWYQPPAQAGFQFQGGAYWYVGAFPPPYYDDRPRYAVVNEAYAPIPYPRPAVDVRLAPGVVQAQIAVGGPGWGVAAVIGGPVAPTPAPVLVAPGPARPGPAVPIGIGVGINLGGPPVVERREIVDERYRHDHRREGWRGPERYHHPPPAHYFAGRAPVERPIFNRGTAQHPLPRVAPQHPAHPRRLEPDPRHR